MSAGSAAFEASVRGVKPAAEPFVNTGELERGGLPPQASGESPPSGSFGRRTFGTMQIGGVRQSMLTLVSTALGAGVLAIAYVIKVVGMGMGAISLLAAAVASFVSMNALMRASAQTGSRSYGELFSFCAGPRAGPVLDFLLYIYGMGSCVGYFVFLGDFLPDIVGAFDGVPSWCSDRSLLVLLAGLIVVPMAAQKDLAALRHVAGVGIIALIYTSVVVCSKAPELYRQATSSVVYWKLDYHVFEAFSICVFAFNCHLNVVPVAGAFQRPTMERIEKVSWRVNVLQLVFYVIMGFAGYLSFLAGTLQDVLKAYPREDYFVMVSRMLLSCSMLVAIPTNINPTVKCALTLIDHFRGLPPLNSPMHTLPASGVASALVAGPGPRATESETFRLVLTFGSLAAQVILAVVVKGIAPVLSLLGASVATLMMLVIPAYCMGVCLPATPWSQAQQIFLYALAPMSALSIPFQILEMAGWLSQA